MLRVVKQQTHPTVADLCVAGTVRLGRLPAQLAVRQVVSQLLARQFNAPLESVFDHPIDESRLTGSHAWAPGSEDSQTSY